MHFMVRKQNNPLFLWWIKALKAKRANFYFNNVSIAAKLFYISTLFLSYWKHSLTILSFIFFIKFVTKEVSRMFIYYNSLLFFYYCSSILLINYILTLFIFISVNTVQHRERYNFDIIINIRLLFWLSFNFFG
jgi:hypothetical protein